MSKVMHHKAADLVFRLSVDNIRKFKRKIFSHNNDKGFLFQDPEKDAFQYIPKYAH